MAETYTVLARRYRSQNFDELVGQEAIAQTLKNAITSGRVAHAFLFTGTRGVGKTSSARILAKAINCPNITAGQPCGTCETCKAIARGEDIDVIEIDGASNNGVDQIRELRQSAGIRPAHSPYKVYIIDEVHMLSIGAFNALLKTLEEPPEHVKFIFATTDIHKVPATILSRCQRFDFKNIPSQKIADHLRKIIEQEGVEADEDAVLRIARLGNGSMRDALSLLDRVLSLGEKRITENLLEELLGKPPTAAIAELVQAVALGDAGAALTRADGLLRDGMGAEQVLGELIEFLRGVMLVCVCGEKTDLLEVAAELRPTFTELAKKFDAATLVHLIALCEQTLRNLKSTAMGRPLFDALIVRLAMSEQFSAIRDLLAGGGGDGSAQKKNDPVRSPALPVTAPMVAAPTAPPPATPAISAPAYDGAPRTPAATTGRPTLGRPMPPTPAPAPVAPPEAMPETPETDDAPLSTDGSDLNGVWEAVRKELVATKNGTTNTMFGGTSKLLSYDPATGEALLAIPGHLLGFAEGRPKAAMEQALSTVLGRQVRLTLQGTDGPGGGNGGAGSTGPSRPAESSRYGNAPPPPNGGGGYVAQVPTAAQRVPPEVEDQVREQPVVRKLMENLGANITSIELLDTGGPGE